MPVWGVSFPFDLIVSFTAKGLLDGNSLRPRGTFLPAMMMILSAEVWFIGFRKCHENLMDAWFFVGGFKEKEVDPETFTWISGKWGDLLGGRMVGNAVNFLAVGWKQLKLSLDFVCIDGPKILDESLKLVNHLRNMRISTIINQLAADKSAVVSILTFARIPCPCSNKIAMEHSP